MCSKTQDLVGDSLLEWLSARAPGRLEAEGWVRRELPAHDELCAEGEPADSLHVVVSGALVVNVGGFPVDCLGPGGTVGEASVFFSGDRRRATVIADGETRLLTLAQRQLRRLRRSSPSTYERLLSAALAELWKRLAQQDRVISEMTQGMELPATSRRPPLRRLIRGLVDGGKGRTPDPVAALSLVPVLDCATPSELAQVAGAARPQRVPPGHALFLEGDLGRELYVVADGRLSIVREALGHTGRELSALGPGSVLGAGGFLFGSPRNAAAVAPDGCWVLCLSPDDVAQLAPACRRLVDEALLATMRAQLASANELLAQVKRPEGRFQALLGAVCAVEGWRAGDPGVQVPLSRVLDPPRVRTPVPEKEPLLDLIRRSVIGRDVALTTPFGTKRMVYADYTASGRSITFIEEFIRQKVMPRYANTHTEASATGLQTTRYREEARAIVARSVGAGDQDDVIFVGSGATGAINKLIDLLDVRRPPRNASARQRPVVFVGAYEHHSNLLPWRHCAVDVEVVGTDASGVIDLADLEGRLRTRQGRRLLIGSFSAASNVTGVATDVVATATLLHRYGALSLWDYAAAGPYVPIEMNPSGEGVDPALAYKDAIFLSPHKFVGGPGTPGVLVVKRHVAATRVPTQPGGGTVDFVTGSQSLYSDSLVHREEAGTPAILESIRCGLVFKLKDAVGGATIHALEQAYVKAAIGSWNQNPAIRVLGPLESERLSIVSFMIRHGRGYVHYNFIVALLNDLFGIQARGGCSCAGPYGALLLGMDDGAGQAYLDMAARGLCSFKPGWARVNFNYFIGEAEFRYIVQAVHLVAAYGFALLPQYRFDDHSGLWTHRNGTPFVPGSLDDLRLEGGRALWDPVSQTLGEEVLTEQLEAGRRVLAQALGETPDPVEAPRFEADVDRWRWFPLQHEVGAWLRHRNGEGSETARAEPSSFDISVHDHQRVVEAVEL